MFYIIGKFGKLIGNEFSLSGLILDYKKWWVIDEICNQIFMI
jgi:hypothetical protein